MKKITTHTLLYILLLAFCSSFNALAKKTTWKSGADDRKADYIYMQALSQHAQDNYGAYFDLLREASTLSSEPTSIDADLGYLEIASAKGDTSIINRGLAKMGKYFAEHPEDFYSSMIYATVSQKLGHTAEARKILKTIHEEFPAKNEVTMMYVESLKNGDSIQKATALQLLDTLIIHEGYSIPLVSQRTSLHMSSADTTAVIKDIQSLLSSTPRSVEARIFAANIYENLGQDSIALHYLDEACNIDPSSGLGFYGRGIYYLNHADTLGYDREVQHAMLLPDLELEIKLEILTQFLQNIYQDPSLRKSIDLIFSKLVDQYPHNEEVNRLYSAYFHAIGEYREAATQMQGVIDANPTNPEDWRALISMWYNVPDYHEAYLASNKASEHFPDDPSYPILSAEAAIMDKDYTAASMQVSKMIECIENYDNAIKSQIYSLSGDIAYKTGDHVRAFDDYEKSISFDQTNAMALNNIAYYLACDNKDLEKAKSYVERSLLIKPENTSAIDTYAWVCFKMADYKEARENIDKALKTMADNNEALTAEILEHAGDIYFMAGEPSTALKYWEQASELDPNNKLLTKKIKNKTYFYE